MVLIHIALVNVSTFPLYKGLFLVWLGQRNCQVVESQKSAVLESGYVLIHLT